MESEVYTRKDLMTLLQCSYHHARKVYSEILEAIPKKDFRKTFNRRLPKHYFDKHLNKV